MATVPTTKFQIVDPRTFDGDPYDVAERAVKQLKGLVDLTVSALGPAELMILNGFMERQAALDQEIDAAAWYETAEYRNWVKIKESLEDTAKRLGSQQKAAGFNPKKR